MKIFNLPLYNGTYADFFQKILSVTSPTLVFTPNPEILYRAYSDADFMKILESATYNVPDGNGLYVAEMMAEGKSFFSACREVFFNKKNVYAKYGDLIKGSDLTKDILELAVKNPLKILIIDRKNTTPKKWFWSQKSRSSKKSCKNFGRKISVNADFCGIWMRTKRWGNCENYYRK